MLSLNQPIFVVGCPRSGTTLVQRMLDAHPDVAIAPETFFVRRFWMRRHTYGTLNDDGNFARILDDITALPEFADMGLSAEAYKEAAWQRMRTYGALFRLLLKQFAAKRGASVVGEKTPDHVLHMDVLHRIQPRGRFVHVVRDPRAVVNSWRTVPWSSGYRWRDAEVWCEHVRAARVPPAGVSELLHHVWFEALVREPEHVLRELCAFLTLDYHPAMLAFHEQQMDTVDAAREPWKARAAHAIDPRVADEWRTELALRHVAEIEAVTKDEMVHWGYTPESDRRTRLLAWIRSRIERIGWKLKLIGRAMQHPA